MAVFDGEVKTRRAVADPKTDKTLPSPGSLSWGGIKGIAGLAGTNGIDCKVVHGDRWQQIDGNHTEQVNANLQSTIMGNETRTIVQNQNLTTMGNVSKSILSNYTRTIIGAELGTNIGPFNRTDIAPITWLCPTSAMFNSGDLYENKIFKGQNYAIRNTNIGVDISTRLENAQVAVHTTSMVGFNTRLRQLETALKIAAVVAGINLADVRATQSETAAMQATVTASKVVVGPRVQTPPESIPGIE